jgi:hypothetical protein
MIVTIYSFRKRMVSGAWFLWVSHASHVPMDNVVVDDMDTWLESQVSFKGLVDVLSFYYMRHYKIYLKVGDNVQSGQVGLQRLVHGSFELSD